MSETTALPNLSPARQRCLLWPREHGAWGMLLVPLVTGAAVGLFQASAIVPLLLFLLASFALFCLRTPVEAALGTSVQRAQTPAERQAVFTAMGIYGALAAAVLAPLLWGGRYPALYLLGAVAALSFGAQALLRKRGRDTRMASQLIGSVGLTSTAAGAYYVATGQFDARAAVVWAANWLFAANQIHYVQLRIHNARRMSFPEKLGRGWGFLLGEALTVVAILALWNYGLLPKLAALAFHPVLLRGAGWFVRHKPLKVHRLGWTELMHAVLFGVMFILSFRLGR